MLFSVLIPLYNAEKYISDCIDSVLCQDYDDYEIVIVDDGSTDNSGLIVDAYQRRYPEKIRVIHKDNTGVLLTRRRAIQEAEGDYIVWVDSDDIIKPALMRVLSDHIRCNTPDIIIYDYEWMDSPKRVIHSLDIDGDAAIVDKHTVCIKLLLGRNMNELCTKCIRRSIIDVDADYSECRHVKMGDDMFCLMPILDEAQTIEYVNESFYRYRVVSSSITHTNNYKSYYSYRTIFERADHYLERWNFSGEECNLARDVFANRIIDCVVQCVNYDKNKEKYDSFVRQVAEDERKKCIFRIGKRKFKSLYSKCCYYLFIAEMYSGLYYFVKMITWISKQKRKRIKGDNL